MPASSFLPKLIFGLAALVGLALGLTTYTFPVIGSVRDADVLAVLHRALGDSARALPGPPAVLPIQSDLQAINPFGEAEEPSHQSAAVEPDAWARQAAATDSAALREWLDRSGLFSGSSDGKNRITTLSRLTLHRGCPLISHLRTVTVIASNQLVEINSDCPRIGAPVEPAPAP